MLTQTKKGNRHIIEFDDIESLYDFVKDTPQHHESQTGTESFAGTKSFAEALSLFRNGWPEGTAQIDHALSMIETAYDSTAQTYQFDVSGLTVDVGTYLTGQPECWLTPVEEHAEKSAVTVQVSAAGNCFIAAETFINRGGAIMAVIDHLARNHIVDLEVMIFATHVQNSEDFQLVYKTTTERTYSKDTLAFLVANPSFLRRIWFAAAERIFQTPSCGSYGHSEDIPAKEQRGYFFETPTKNEIWDSPQKAAEQVKQFLESRKEQ